DIPLLEALVAANPAWHFVFVGSAHLDQSILRLESEPNAHFVGVKPYEETLRFVEHFDVGLIPHLDNDMTRSMNPLKAFVYCAAGVPVVSSKIANLDELADLIAVAEGPIEFEAAIKEALRAGRCPPDAEALAAHSWEVRVEKAIGLIDRASTARDTPASG
ncbi:MAG: glycosyltransferase, partial [Acidimicrobiia bacterium]